MRYHHRHHHHIIYSSKHHLDLLQRIVNEEDEFVSFFEETYRYAIQKVLKLVPRNTADATKVKPTTSKFKCCWAIESDVLSMVVIIIILFSGWRSQCMATAYDMPKGCS